MKTHLRGAAAIALMMGALLVTGCANQGPPRAPVALVIGNGAYGGAVPALPNPEHDGRAVAERLQSSGYKTVLLLDANRLEMIEAIRAFAELATGSPLAVIYYSGHGVELTGETTCFRWTSRSGVTARSRI